MGKMREHFRICSEVRGFIREVYEIQSKTYTYVLGIAQYIFCLPTKRV